MAIFGILLPLGLVTVCGLLFRERSRLLGAVAAAEADATALEGRAAALADHNRVLERDLAVAGQIADFRSFHDGLTALPNRALLLDRLTQALARRTGREGAVAVLCCDLDRFRAVNDALGRAAGDSVLVAVADRARRHRPARRHRGPRRRRRVRGRGRGTLRSGGGDGPG